MPLYRVKWHSDPRDVRSSHWWVLNGVITYTSRMLKDWEGGDHVALVHHLSSRGKTISLLDVNQHVPLTIKYHKEMLANVEALLRLLDSTNEDSLPHHT